MIFQYSIGQVLKLRESSEYKCVVIERYAIECCGGVQLQYGVRLYVTDSKLWLKIEGETERRMGQKLVSLDLVKFCEFELEVWHE